MKINKLKYMTLSGVLSLLMVFAATSCDDANDWSTDHLTNQLFSVHKMRRISQRLLMQNLHGPLLREQNTIL